MNDQLTETQMNALLGKSSQLTPNQSALVLGHSNGVIGNMINGAENMLPAAGAILGGIGGGVVGGAAAAGAGPEAIPFGAYGGAVAGSGIGGAAGEIEKDKLQGQEPSAGDVAKTGAMNAAFEAVGAPVLSAGGKLLEATAKPIVSTIGKGLSKVGDLFGGKGGAQIAETVSEKIRPPVALATKRLASTGETMTKGEREAAINEGRMTPNGKYLPSQTEKRAGEIMKGKTYANPVKTVAAVQKEISTRGKEAETYLAANAKKITNQEDYSSFQAARASSEKYMTPAESNAYDEQVGVFQKILKDYAGDGGYTTANYYSALKDYESQVTANLAKGKDALLVPGGSARIQGAKDVRTVVRDMIGQKNPEFKGKMFDLASLYDAKDNVVSMAEQGGHSWAKRHPIATTLGIGATGFAAEQLGVEELKKFLP